MPDHFYAFIGRAVFTQLSLSCDSGYTSCINYPENEFPVSLICRWEAEEVIEKASEVGGHNLTAQQDIIWSGS
jgi:hypothetical protein